MKATITSLIFLLLSLTVSSQTYKYIGIEEGLSNQKIYKIQKDARGYMWFLTHVNHARGGGDGKDEAPELDGDVFVLRPGDLLVYRKR